MQCCIICKCTFPSNEHIVWTHCECYENGIFEHYLGNIHTFLAVGYSLMIQDCTTYLSSWFVWWVDTIVLISEQYGSEESPFVIPPHTLSSSIKGGCLLVKLIVMISDKNSFERQLPVNRVTWILHSDAHCPHSYFPFDLTQYFFVCISIFHFSWHWSLGGKNLPGNIQLIGLVWRLLGQMALLGFITLLEVCSVDLRQ